MNLTTCLVSQAQNSQDFNLIVSILRTKIILITFLLLMLAF